MFKTIEDVLQEKAESPSLDLDLGNSRLGLVVIKMMAAVVGFWGLLCLVSGLGNCGNLQELGRSLLTALTGM